MTATWANRRCSCRSRLKPLSRKCNLSCGPSNPQLVKRWFQEDTFFSLMRLRGMECGSDSGYAEVFYCRKLVL